MCLGQSRFRAAGATVWLTGLSGAGKSTIAGAVWEILSGDGIEAEILDGDELRASISADLGFSPADRTSHVRRVGFLAEMLARHGVVVLVPVIAPYRQVRADVRAHHKDRGSRYLEVHVATPVAECARRDPKGLYARAADGALSGLTGVDAPYEEPIDPDLRLDTTSVSVSAAVEVLLRLLRDRGVVVDVSADSRQQPIPPLWSRECSQNAWWPSVLERRPASD